MSSWPGGILPREIYSWYAPGGESARVAGGGAQLPVVQRRDEPAAAFLPLGGDDRSRLGRPAVDRALSGVSSFCDRFLVGGKRPAQVARRAGGEGARCSAGGGGDLGSV